MIRIYCYTRNKIGIGIDDDATVRKVIVKSSEQVILVPTEELKIEGLEHHLPELLEGRVVTKGDIIPPNIMGKRIGFVVTSTLPSYVASLIDSDTQFINSSVPKVGAKRVQSTTQKNRSAFLVAAH